MNYIKRLESDLCASQAEIIAYESTIRDLQLYLSGPKFSKDTTVQVCDVLTRLEQGLATYRANAGL